MPSELALGIVVPIFMGKGDIRKCGYYKVVKLLEHVMMVVESLLQKSFVK